MKILVASVHHHDLARSRAQASQVARLVDSLSSHGWAVGTIESSWQDSPSDYDAGILAMLRILWARESLMAAEVRRRSGDGSNVSFRRYLSRWSRIIRFVGVTDRRLHLTRLLHVQRAVTRKHIHVWLSFLNSACERLVVLEDDFVLKHPKSGEEIVTILKNYGSRFDYIDLAGGFQIEDLGIALKDDEELIEVDYIFTNTSCGYTINRRLAEAMVALAYRKPQSVNIGTDFFPLLLNSHGFEGKSLLLSNPPLHHGSFIGSVESSFPYAETLAKKNGESH